MHRHIQDNQISYVASLPFDNSLKKEALSCNVCSSKVSLASKHLTVINDAYVKIAKNLKEKMTIYGESKESFNNFISKKNELI